MGKRSNFERRKQDKYDTPEKAVYPLLRHLTTPTRFIEPCAGKGLLIRWLETAGHQCVARSDVSKDARTTKYYTLSYTSSSDLSRRLCGYVTAR